MWNPFNFWPALFWISFFPVVFSELPSPRSTTSITKALKSNACYVQFNECVGLFTAECASKTWFFTCPLKANSEGCQSRHSQFLLQFKWIFVKFFPVFAQLYLMKHAWLPTTQGMSCSMLAELTVTGTPSWISSERVMFVANHPKQGNSLKYLMEGKEDTGS